MPGFAGPAGDLRECLRRYLEEHPDAADSLPGIRQWWLPKRLHDVTLEELEAAIAQLVDSGEIQRKKLPDSSELYTAGHRARKH
jgi:hypothetical protein